MATVPIVTDVTLSQLDALVATNGLNEGLQYKVTDKDWLLLANSSNSLIPVTNVIKIQNGDVIPIYINSLFILIDTGEIVTDHTVTPYELIIPANYYPVSVIVDIIGSSQGIRGEQIGDLFTATSFEVGVSLFSSFLSARSMNVLLYGFAAGGEGEYVRFIFKCEKISI